MAAGRAARNAKQNDCSGSLRQPISSGISPKEADLQDRERTDEQPNKSNWTPWVVMSCLAVAALALAHLPHAMQIGPASMAAGPVDSAPKVQDKPSVLSIRDLPRSVL